MKKVESSLIENNLISTTSLSILEIIDIFDSSEALIKLRKQYNLPLIDIYGKKDNHSSN